MVALSRQEWVAGEQMEEYSAGSDRRSRQYCLTRGLLTQLR